MEGTNYSDPVDEPSLYDEIISHLERSRNDTSNVIGEASGTDSEKNVPINSNAGGEDVEIENNMTLSMDQLNVHDIEPKAATEIKDLCVPRKCVKRLAEYKEIITEIVETEDKYGLDLQITLEEFYKPLLLAGLLTQEQLSAIFLNIDILLENSQTLLKRIRDAIEIAKKQGDEYLVTVNIGQIILNVADMLDAFEWYCVRQGSASIRLAHLEKDKKLLQIFLQVSQSEKPILRRLDLNAFLMVPVQRITKYPLLLSRLYQVTPPYWVNKNALQEAQEKIEMHLNQIDWAIKGEPLKLWRRISLSNLNQSTSEIDLLNTKLRKMSDVVLNWNHDNVEIALEAPLLYIQPTDNNWQKGNKIKWSYVHAMLVPNGKKPSANNQGVEETTEPIYGQQIDIREPALLLVRQREGHFTLSKEPLYLDRCIVYTETDTKGDGYFELHDISSNTKFIFKAEDNFRTNQWHTQLQYYAQAAGSWRKRRNALGYVSGVSKLLNDKINIHGKSLTVDITRNDLENTFKTISDTRSKQVSTLNKANYSIHFWESCDGTVEINDTTNSGVLWAPFICRRCVQKRNERKNLINKFVEIEAAYGRDLQITLEEFYQPMLSACLLTHDQLSAIFLNTEELLENNQTLLKQMRKAIDMAKEKGDDDLLTINIGRLVLDVVPMLHAFERYCIRQASSSILLKKLQKEKKLLGIFVEASQMENARVRGMDLNSFLIIPMQHVTKYQLQLADLYEVTPPHLHGREALKQAQELIEMHLKHISNKTNDVPPILWRGVSLSRLNRPLSEIDLKNIKLRKICDNMLAWNSDEVRIAFEGPLLYNQVIDNAWRKERNIKWGYVYAFLVPNGMKSVNFPRKIETREPSLLLVEKSDGHYTLMRKPLWLGQCIVYTDTYWNDDYFELHEMTLNCTFIFKAEDNARTNHWYNQLQCHAQGMAGWRKRRNALSNIMIMPK